MRNDNGIAELAKGRCELLKQLDGLNINPEGRDVNGNKVKWKMLTDEVDKIDVLIKELSNLKTK